MIHKDYCSHCKTTGVPMIKYCKKQNTQYYYCRDCARKKQNIYYQNQQGRAAVRRAQRNYDNKNPQKYKARSIFNTALKEGKLDKPFVCELCHVDKRLQAHHFNYAEPLRVIFVCIPCHASLHR